MHLTKAKERLISSLLGRIIQYYDAGEVRREQDQPRCTLTSDSMRNPRSEVQK
jgi:hypothetical protein